MAGVQLTLDTQDAQRLTRRLQRWASRPRFASLLASIGAEVESQTRRRIEDERTSPEGVPWRDWSAGYAATRHGNHNLLQNEGDLVDSLNFVVDSKGVSVGTHLVYGAIHQFGGEAAGKAIPARPYLGVSQENAEDLSAIIDDWMDTQLERLS